MSMYFSQALYIKIVRNKNKTKQYHYLCYGLVASQAAILRDVWQELAYVIVFCTLLFTFVSFIPSLKVIYYEEFKSFNLIWLTYFICPREASSSTWMVWTFPQEIQNVMHLKLTQLPGHGKVGWCISVTGGSFYLQ